MSHITLGREMYFLADQIGRKEIPSDVVLLSDLQNVLNGRDCFMMCGQSFDLLHKLGFVETSKIKAENATPPYYVNVIERSVKEREHIVHKHQRTFQKVDDNKVTELYFMREEFTFKKDHNDYFYRLVLKGTYLKDSLPDILDHTNVRKIKFPKMKNPTIIGYKKNGDISVTCTVHKHRVIWFFDGDHAYQDNVIYKEYESDNVFDVAIVNYTNKRRIESVTFRLGKYQIDLKQIADVVPELMELRPVDQLNWEQFITPEQITVLEMKVI